MNKTEPKIKELYLNQYSDSWGFVQNILIYTLEFLWNQWILPHEIPHHTRPTSPTWPKWEYNKSDVKRRNTIGCLDQYMAPNSRKQYSLTQHVRRVETVKQSGLRDSLCKWSYYAVVVFSSICCTNLGWLCIRCRNPVLLKFALLNQIWT